LVLGVTLVRPVVACPFCSSFSSTLTQDLAITEAAAFGVCVSAPDADDSASYPKYRFKVLDILKGDAVSAPGEEVVVPSATPFSLGDQVLLVAVREENLWEWGTVGPLSEAARNHIRKLETLPKSGLERMGYFLPLLLSEDTFLANDAFNEFAMAPIEEMATVKPLLDRRKVIATILDPDTKLELRRLHWTLLSLCGRPEDVQVALDAINRRLNEDEDTVGFDSALSCAMVLGGEESLEMIEQRILAQSDARYRDIYSAVLAIRVHGTEFRQISRARLLESLRLVLEKPEVADLVIPDLARWEDWSQIDKLVELFAMPTEKSQYLRVPVVRYLQTCPLPEAKVALEKCKEIDPEAVRRAQSFFVPSAKS
jgi:hypothetical protein